MNDKGDMALTPSSALQDEVARRLLEAWEAVRGSEAGIGEFRAMVMQAKEQGVQFLGDGGNALLGQEMVRSPALRSELSAADRAYDVSGVHRLTKLTPYRRPILTPLAPARSGPEPTELISL